MAVRAILLLLGLFNAVNGLLMLAAPDTWYQMVPGVTATGPINHHFIIDIGLAFVASGLGLIAGSRRGAVTAAWAVAGATWPAMHALFHVSLWLRHGFPVGLAHMASEYVGVFAASAAGLWFAIMHARQEGTFR